eukprot:TRINITY_DN2659_c0_g1_i1.p1 TRINITY_DN2659_c0_g1~~TRINITY_DN2659_c0_g1_i1.p1  ORF type:complete len:199 (-),score=48.78 TRINITY_DN2659_c0_g1_i1:474-1070(-)
MQNTRGTGGEYAGASMGGMRSPPGAVPDLLGQSNLMKLQANQQKQLQYLGEKSEGVLSGERPLTNIGGMYLSGMGMGAVIGAIDGFKHLGSEPTAKLKANRLVSAVTKHGVGWGNTLGILALYYTTIRWGVSTFVPGMDKDQVYGPVGSAAAAGLLYKSGGGPRVALAAGGLGAVIVGSLVTLREMNKKGKLPKMPWE